MTAKKPKPLTVKPDHKPTARELAAIRKFGRAERSPRVKMSKLGDAPAWKTDHPDELIGFLMLMEAIGTEDEDFASGLIKQLANAGSRGLDEEGTNFMLSIIKGIKPRDEVEAMLAAQMAAIHAATMTFARPGCPWSACLQPVASSACPSTR